MAMHEGDFRGHRGKREAMETVQRNDAMAKREAFEAGRIRDRLEKQSSVGQRASIAAVLRKAGVGTGGRTCRTILHGLKLAIMRRLSAGLTDRRTGCRARLARWREACPSSELKRVRDAEGRLREDGS